MSIMSSTMSNIAILLTFIKATYTLGECLQGELDFKSQ